MKKKRAITSPAGAKSTSLARREPGIGQPLVLGIDILDGERQMAVAVRPVHRLPGGPC